MQLTYKEVITVGTGRGPENSGPFQARPDPGDGSKTSTNFCELNLIRTVFFLHLLKLRPGPVPTLVVIMPVTEGEVEIHWCVIPKKAQTRYVLWSGEKFR